MLAFTGMTDVPTAIKNGHLTAEHLGSQVHVGRGKTVLLGELDSVHHGVIQNTDGIPRTTITVKIHAGGIEQQVTVALHTDDHDVTILATEQEWKG